MQLYADSGTEKFIPFARRKLAQWKEAALRSGIASFAKTIFADEGTTIYVNSLALGHGQYRDRIRITGGTTWVCADPVQPLWGIASALLPDSKPALIADYAPTIQHIQDVYLERSRTVTRTISGKNYDVKIDQEWAIKHTLVVCRYCKRVAEFSWNEVKAFDATFVPPAGQETLATYTVTGQYVGNDTVNVSLVDVKGDGAQFNSRDLPHGLVPAAFANSWGWYALADLPALPTLHQPPDRSGLYTLMNLSDPGFGTPEPWTVMGVSTLSPRISGLSYSPAAGAVFTTLTPVTTGVVVGAVPPFDHPWSQDQEATYVWGQGALEWFSFGQTRILPGSPGYAESQADQVAYNAAVGPFVDQVIALIQSIAALLSTKLTTDVAEITTDPQLPYKDQKAAIVIPTQATVALKAEMSLLGSSGVVSKTFTLVADHRILAVLGGSVCGVAISLPAPSSTPPYKVVFQSPLKFSFDSNAKAFTLAPDSKLAYKKSYFSSGADVTKLEATPIGEISWGGMYQVTASPNATTQFKSLLGKSDDPATGTDPAARMKAMCVGQPSFQDVSYAAYSAIFTKRGAAYRKTDHTYTAGGYTVTQAAIPNTDAP